MVMRLIKYKKSLEVTIEEFTSVKHCVDYSSFKKNIFHYEMKTVLVFYHMWCVISLEDEKEISELKKQC